MHASVPQKKKKLLFAAFLRQPSLSNSDLILKADQSVDSFEILEESHWQYLHIILWSLATFFCYFCESLFINKYIAYCQALVPVQPSPVQVEGLGLSLWSLLTTTTTTANFSKNKLDCIGSYQKISSYIIIPTAHHHHRKLFKK